jgi:UV DNA damage repair endonuclease
MANHNCEIKTALLQEYMATLEKLKVAERKHKEIVMAGTGQGVMQRSAKRIEAIKKLCSTARENYSDHCHDHRC